MVGIGVLVGRSVEFRYPRHNLNVPGIPRRMETRRCRVEAVRDLKEKPLDPLTVAMTPAVDRGEHLIECFDYDRHAARSFYWERMQDVRLIPNEPEEIPPPHTIVLVKRPEGWEPASVEDVPPNVERHTQPEAHLAEAFAFGFNGAELKQPQGWWAVPVVMPARTE